MSGTTNIDDLPGGDENITMVVQEKNANVMNNALEQNNMNQFVTEIQQASASGMLQLPSRDIPMNTENIIQDEEIKPNYVPKQEDYIKEFESNQEILNQQIKKENKQKSIDVIFDNLHLYILIGIIYFFFQLPIFNKGMMKYLPFCYFSDGNLNLSGYISKTIFFVFVIFILYNIMNFIETI